MLACLVLILIGLTALAVERVQSNMYSCYYNDKNNDNNDDNYDTMATTTMYEMTMISQYSDPAKSFWWRRNWIVQLNDRRLTLICPCETLFLAATTRPPIWWVLYDIHSGRKYGFGTNAVPGNGIGEFLIGFVNHPLRAMAIQLLLNHDLTKPLRLCCEDAPLDASDAITSVTIDTMNLVWYQDWSSSAYGNMCLRGWPMGHLLCDFVDASHCANEYEWTIAIPAYAFRFWSRMAHAHSPAKVVATLWSFDGITLFGGRTRMWGTSLQTIMWKRLHSYRNMHFYSIFFYTSSLLISAFVTQTTWST